MKLLGFAAALILIQLPQPPDLSPFQKADAIRYEKLAGTIVRYAPGSTSAGAVLVIKVAGDGRFILLRFSAAGFGFDAPSPKKDQLLPKRVFSSAKTEWTFQVHSPSYSEEEGVCNWAPPKFKPLPGAENDQVPSSETLECMILSALTPKL
jgi:hypothetical protein